jgi:hypothetical protein
MKPMLPEFGRCGELFQTPSGTAFADIPVNEHRETWPIRSKRFRSWLRRCHYEAPSVGCRLRNRRLAGRHFGARLWQPTAQLPSRALSKQIR